jgi:hypothetical protein
MQGDIGKGRRIMQRSILVPTIYYSPVTGMGSVRLTAPGLPPAVAAPGPAASGGIVPHSGVVGHGTVKLHARPPAYNAMFVPGAPPPVRELAGQGRVAPRIRAY